MPKLQSLFAAALLLLVTACGGGNDEAYELPDIDVTIGQRCLVTFNHHDGDTFDCQTEAETFTVRLAAVDAPELDQAFGGAARGVLQSLTPDGTQVSCYKTDKYGRRVCRVYTPYMADVQAEMLAQGLAWYLRSYAYEQTSDEITRYTNLQVMAQSQRIGLWSQSNPQAPWDCRSTGACR